MQEELGHEIRSFVKRRPSGWPTNMHVIRLGGNDLLIHSPTRIDEATFAQIEAIGTPRILFAPNHFHHLGLPAYRKRFPNAVVAASANALPRLRAKGHEGLRPLEDVELPSTVRFVVPSGTKNGEAWLSIDHDEGPVWIVGDAFFNEGTPMRGAEAVVLRWLNTAPGLSIGTTFKMLGIRNDTQYRASVSEAISRETPSRILFSHGDPLKQGAATQLRQILNTRVTGENVS